MTSIIDRLRRLDSCAAHARDQLGLPDATVVEIGNLTGVARVAGRAVTRNWLLGRRRRPAICAPRRSRPPPAATSSSSTTRGERIARRGAATSRVPPQRGHHRWHPRVRRGA